MIRKIDKMTSSDMEYVSRSMTESFMDYDMTGNNLGMLEHLDREHFCYLVRGYLEAALRNGSLYCAGIITKLTLFLKLLPQRKALWNGFHRKVELSLTVMKEHSLFQRYVDISDGRDFRCSLWMTKERR